MPPVEDFMYKNAGDKRQQFVGLVNLKNICYMNSLMQQIFMVPTFRYNLMCTEMDAKWAKARPEIVDGMPVIDDMRYQAQRMMTNLEASTQTPFHTRPYVHSFKEFDGRPTDFNEQKDAQEYFTLLMDRMQEQLKQTSRKYLVQDTFIG